MPFEYRLDREKQILRLTTIEPLTIADAEAMVKRQVADGVWGIAILLDARRAVLTAEQAREHFEQVQKMANQHGPHGPVAVATSDGVDIQTLQAYKFRSQHVGLAMQVFRDIGDAERWLESEAAR
jgi:hypothetical protein